MWNIVKYLIPYASSRMLSCTAWRSYTSLLPRARTFHRRASCPNNLPFFIAKNRQQLGILRNLTIITWFLYIENYQLSAGLHEQNTWIFERFERKLDWNGGFPPISGLDTDSTWFNNQKYELRQWVDHKNHVSIYLLKLFREGVWGINSRRPKNESWQIMANHGKYHLVI